MGSGKSVIIVGSRVVYKTKNGAGVTKIVFRFAGQCLPIGRGEQMRGEVDSTNRPASVGRLVVRIASIGCLLTLTYRSAFPQESFINLGRLPYITDAETFAITAENPN